MATTSWLLFTGGFAIGVLITLAAVIVLMFLHARAAEADLDCERLSDLRWRPSSGRQPSSMNAPSVPANPAPTSPGSVGTGSSTYPRGHTPAAGAAPSRTVAAPPTTSRREPDWRSTAPGYSDPYFAHDPYAR